MKKYYRIGLFLFIGLQGAYASVQELRDNFFGTVRVEAIKSRAIVSVSADVAPQQPGFSEYESSSSTTDFREKFYGVTNFHANNAITQDPINEVRYTPKIMSKRLKFKLPDTRSKKINSNHALKLGSVRHIRRHKKSQIPL